MEANDRQWHQPIKPQEPLSARIRAEVDADVEQRFRKEEVRLRARLRRTLLEAVVLGALNIVALLTLQEFRWYLTGTLVVIVGVCVQAAAQCRIMIGMHREMRELDRFVMVKLLERPASGRPS